jgi:ankyrin repeat protein
MPPVIHSAFDAWATALWHNTVRPEVVAARQAAWEKAGSPHKGWALTLCQATGWPLVIDEILNSKRALPESIPAVVWKEVSGEGERVPSALESASVLHLLMLRAQRVYRNDHGRQSIAQTLSGLLDDPRALAQSHVLFMGRTPASQALDGYLYADMDDALILQMKRLVELASPHAHEASPAAQQALIEVGLGACRQDPGKSKDLPSWWWKLCHQQPDFAHARAIEHSLHPLRQAYLGTDRKLPHLTQALLDHGVNLSSPSASLPSHSAVATAMSCRSAAWLKAWVSQGGSLHWRDEKTQDNILHLLARQSKRGPSLGPLRGLDSTHIQGLADSLNATGDGPLHLAATRLNVELVQQLVAWGANPARTNRRGRTPLAMVKRTNAQARARGEALLGLLDPLGQSGKQGIEHAIRSLSDAAVARLLPHSLSDSERLAWIDLAKKSWHQSAGSTRDIHEEAPRFAAILGHLGATGPEHGEGLWSWALKHRLPEVWRQLWQDGCPFPENNPELNHELALWADQGSREFQSSTPLSPHGRFQRQRVADFAQAWCEQGMLLDDPQTKGAWWAWMHHPSIRAFHERQLLEKLSESATPSRPRPRV